MCESFVNGYIIKGLIRVSVVVLLDIILLHFEVRTLVKNIMLEEENVDLLSNSLIFCYFV